MQRSRRSRNASRRAFTLIEVMVVVLIIGMLTTIVGVSVARRPGQGRQTTARAQVEILANAVEEYHMGTSAYPAKLVDLVQNPGNAKWDGPYLRKKQVPKDPWGNEYHYDTPGEHDTFDICSYGSDGAPGGEGGAADINSWETGK